MSEPEETQKRIIFAILDRIADGYKDEVKAWVNDNFYPEYYEVLGYGDDATIEDVQLSWS
jgi:basic membrane lipoprotein Med (substrate-binding protein (PBP1-ABC) superfamily)